MGAQFFARDNDVEVGGGRARAGRHGGAPAHDREVDAGLLEDDEDLLEPPRRRHPGSGLRSEQVELLAQPARLDAIQCLSQNASDIRQTPP